MQDHFIYAAKTITDWWRQPKNAIGDTPDAYATGLHYVPVARWHIGRLLSAGESVGAYVDAAHVDCLPSLDSERAWVPFTNWDKPPSTKNAKARGLQLDLTFDFDANGLPNALTLIWSEGDLASLPDHAVFAGVEIDGNRVTLADGTVEIRVYRARLRWQV